MLKKPNSKIYGLQGFLHIFDHTIEKLSELDKKLVEHLLNADSIDTDIDAETLIVERVDEHILQKDSVGEINSESGSNPNHNRRKLKLPEIEINKFEGDIRDAVAV